MLSLPHLVVLFVLALIIFGPEKLPELARKLGKATAEFRKMTSDFRFALEDEVRDLERQSRIREEEIAAAASAVKPPPTPPIPAEFAVPRESQAAAATVQTEAEHPPHVDPGPEQPATPQTVSVPQEKPSDDNTAV
jgi:sec-independent protein translocase protein TatB